MYKVTVESNIDLFKRAIIQELNYMDERDSKQLRESLNFYCYMREFRTVCLQLPRRCGNTHLALEIFKEYDNAILITPFEKHIKYLQENLHLEGYHINKIYAESSVLNGKLKGMKYDLIILDEVKISDRLYECFGFNFPKILKVGQI